MQQDAQIGRELTGHLGAIERTPLAANKTELLKLAHLRPGRRDAVLWGQEGRAKLWNVVAGDCLEVLAGDVAVTAGVGPGSVRMIFADPPYDLGKKYDGGGAGDDRKGEAA